MTVMRRGMEGCEHLWLLKEGLLPAKVDPAGQEALKAVETSEALLPLPLASMPNPPGSIVMQRMKAAKAIMSLNSALLARGARKLLEGG